MYFFYRSNNCLAHLCIQPLAVCFPALVLRSISDDEKVDYPGGEVQSHVCFTVDHCYTVSVAIAGSGHATTEQQERGPAYAHRVRFSSVYSTVNE